MDCDCSSIGRLESGKNYPLTGTLYKKRWSMLRGISIRKLAEKAGLGHTSVQSIREGRCMSSMLTYWYIAKALDVTVGEILGETGGAE